MKVRKGAIITVRVALMEILGMLQYPDAQFFWGPAIGKIVQYI